MASQLRNMNGPLSYYRTTKIRFEEEQGQYHFCIGYCIRLSVSGIAEIVLFVTCRIARSSACHIAGAAHMGRERSDVDDGDVTGEDERDNTEA